MSDSRDAPLPALLAELEATLSALRDELGPTDGPGDQAPGGSRRRPPGLRSVLRFTEEYTIPTLVAILEVNIRLLELLGGLLRAIDPEKSVTARGRPREPAGQGLPERAARGLRAAADATGRTAGRGTADRLAEGLAALETALEETDLPEDEAARSLLTEARELSAEVQRRLDEEAAQTDLGRFRADRDGRGPQAAGEAVTIEVEGAPEAESDTGGEQPNVDVDAELESIKDEVGTADGDEAGETSGEPAGNTADDAESGGSGDGVDTDDADDVER